MRKLIIMICTAQLLHNQPCQCTHTFANAARTTHLNLLMFLHYHCFCCPTQEAATHDPNFQNGLAKNKDQMCFLILSNFFFKQNENRCVLNFAETNYEL